MQETARSNSSPAMGGIREDVIHRMGRRCREWDYSARAIYLVTVCLKERGRPVLAEWPEFRAAPETVRKNLAVSGEANNARRKTLGDIIRRFKTGCREVGWEDGYVDNILFREGQLAREIEYLHDNPRRLYEKRAHPEMFRRVVDLPVNLAVSGEFCASPETAKFICASPETAKFTGHFQALGNAALLKRPVLLQVQCSRSDFRYRRERLPGEGWKILRDAEGNLLLLAPAAWPHVPGEKPPTRESSLILNRIAQLLCGENAADIDYRGATFSDIDSAVRTALRPPASNTGDLT